MKESMSRGGSATQAPGFQGQNPPSTCKQTLMHTHTKQQLDCIGLLERKINWLEAKVCNTKEVVKDSDQELLLDPEAVIADARRALEGGGMPDPMDTNPEGLVQQAKAEERKEQCYLDRQKRQKALAGACKVDFQQAGDKADASTTPWWKHARDGEEDCAGSQGGTSHEEKGRRPGTGKRRKA